MLVNLSILMNCEFAFLVHALGAEWHNDFYSRFGLFRRSTMCSIIPGHLDEVHGLRGQLRHKSHL